LERKQKRKEKREEKEKELKRIKRKIEIWRYINKKRGKRTWNKNKVGKKEQGRYFMAMDERNWRKTWKAEDDKEIDGR